MSDIQELFSRDPLTLTRDDTLTIINHYRANRNQYKLVEKTGAIKEPKAKAAPKKTDLNLTLDDLF